MDVYSNLVGFGFNHPFLSWTGLSVGAGLIAVTLDAYCSDWLRSKLGRGMMALQAGKTSVAGEAGLSNLNLYVQGRHGKPLRGVKVQNGHGLYEITNEDGVIQDCPAAWFENIDNPLIVFYGGLQHKCKLRLVGTLHILIVDVDVRDGE